MAITRGTFVRKGSVDEGRTPASRGLRKHSVAVAMVLLFGVQGSALAATSDSSVAQPAAVQADVSTAGTAASSAIQADAGLIGVLATEIACGGMLLVGLRRYAADRRSRG